MSYILVVGGAGYIGSHMVLALNDAGYSPVVFDNLSRGFADAVVAAPLVTGDLASPQDLQSCFRTYDVSLVMHFSGFGLTIYVSGLTKHEQRLAVGYHAKRNSCESIIFRNVHENVNVHHYKDSEMLK